jgi:hypothetical protein
MDERELVGLLHRADWTRPSLTGSVRGAAESVLSMFGLDVHWNVGQEDEAVCGRAGVQFSAVPVAGDRRRGLVGPGELSPTLRWPEHEGYERVVAVVDATLGFLLCCEFQFGDRDADVMNFVSLAVGAEADPSVFAAPPGSIFGDGAALAHVPGGPVAGTGGTPVGDDLLHLLYRGGVGMAPFTATLHEWTDGSDSMTVHTVDELRAAELVDGSWLLRCRLDGGEEVVADGRPGYRVIATARPGVAPPGSLGWASGAWLPAVAVVDAATGRLLRLTRYLGGQPAGRLEFRSVSDGGPDDFGFTPPDGAWLWHSCAMLGLSVDFGAGRECRDG